MRAHPDVQDVKIEESFRFDVIQKHRTAFNRQLSEVLAMKASNCYVMNLKDEYTRCVIPDVNLTDREWQDQHDDRVKINCSPRRRIINEHHDNLQTRNTAMRQQKTTVTTFVRKQYVRNNRMKK